jgi:glutamate synthase (NADPH/NADH) small chain
LEVLVRVRVEWVNGGMQEVPGRQFQLRADLVPPAMGFLGARRHGILEQSRVALGRWMSS